MNYLTEINMFYDWLETHPLTPNAITLWHGLMFIANRSGWSSPLAIPLSTLEQRTSIPRTTIYRERDRLREAGLIDFTTRGGRSAGRYIIHSFAERFVSQSETQSRETPPLVSHIGKQNEVKDEEIPQFVSRCGNIYKLNYNNKLNNKEIIKEELEVADESAPPPTNPEKREKEKSCAKKEKEKKPPLFEMSKWLDTLEPPWQELMQTWLEYKSSRKERYKSELSATKCLEQLRRLSEQNANTAQQIIDQSIANNWAGLFELKRQPYYARNDSTKIAKGQHIGQILQPESEEKRNKILANFGKK